jgi:hypothetical protein
MALPVDVSFAILTPFRRGVGMGFRLKIPLENYDPVGKLIEFKAVRRDDQNITYETDSTGDFIEAFPAVGDEAPYVLIAIPSSVMSSIAVAGKETNYGIDFRANSDSDPDFRLQGDLFWTEDVGAPPA